MFWDLFNLNGEAAGRVRVEGGGWHGIPLVLYYDLSIRLGYNEDI